MTGYQWVALALVSALSLATMDALTKKALRGADEHLVGWLRLLLAAPFLLAILLFVEKPALDRTFYRAFALAMPFEVLAFVLYIKALRASPISLTIPFLAFTPVFLIAVSYLIVGEEVSPRGIGGITLIAAGSYVLNFHHLGKGLLEPFRAITREKGSVLMLMVAFIFSITSSLGKLAINHSSPLFFGTTYFIVLALIYTPFGLPGMRRSPLSRAGWGTMLIVGALNALMVVSHVLAISLANVAYMIAVKRSSLLFSVLYGYLIFREGYVGERLIGALLMLAGFVLVVTAS
jgi:drug/metabolite transporter (DMT)-like permease